MPDLKLTTKDVRLLDELGIADPAEITRVRLQELDHEMRAEAEDTMLGWDHFEYLTTASDRDDREQRRLKLERDALGRLLDRAERQKRRRDRALWIAAGLLWAAAAALLWWKGWI